MGGSLQKAISRCCRFPSLKCKDSEEPKKPKSKKIIAVIPTNEGSQQETDLNFAKKDSAMQLQSTANTNVFSHSNASFAISDIRITDIGSGKVSFQTVKEKVKKEVLGTFMKFCEQKYGIFEQMKQQDGVWRQTKTGSFVCMKQDQFICIFSHEAYYEGEIKRDAHLNYLPHGKGILIVADGLYQGNFIDGRANGSGEFTQSKTRTSFDGEWLDGSFTIGVIQNQSIIFRGTMMNGFAEGQGSLFFKKMYEQYKGSFKNGLFEGEFGMILSNNYQYIGGFKAGKKEGAGRLTKAEEKVQLNTKSLKIKSYFPPLNLSGEWQSDTFIKSQPQI